MALQNYLAMLPQTGGFESGYQTGAAIRNDQFQQQQQQMQMASSKEKQQNIKSLSDLYSAPDFQKLSPEQQVQTALPLVAKINPDAAFEITRETQAQAAAEKKEKLKTVMSLIETFTKNDDQAGIDSIMPALKANFPELADLGPIQISGKKAVMETFTDIGANNQQGLSPGRYKVKFEMDPISKQMNVLSMSPEESTLESLEGSVGGVPVMGRFDKKTGKVFGEDGQEIKGFQPKLPARVVSGQMGFGTAGGAGGTSSGDKQFDRLMARLPATLDADSELKGLRAQVDAATQLRALTNLDNNALAQMGAVFSMAKVFDPGGRLSNQDVQMFMGGNTSLIAGAERAYSKYIKGKPLMPEDVAALKSVANATEKVLRVSYNRKLQSRQTKYTKAAKKFGPDNVEYVKDMFAGEFMDVDTPQQKPMATTQSAGTAPAPQPGETRRRFDSTGKEIK